MAPNVPPACLQEKQAFYSGIDEAFADSDDEPGAGLRASVDVLRMAAEKKPRPMNESSKTSLPRSASDTNLAKHSLRRQHEEARNDRPEAGSSSKIPRTLAKGATFAAPSLKDREAPIAPPTAIPKVKMTGKRKRDGTIALVPEAQQIFKGLHFYFFPPDDVNPARAMRIMKALEFGATWQENWNDSITHVVADKLYDYEQLAKYLRQNAKMDTVPGNVLVVNEMWPPECMSLKILMPAEGTRFAVKGCPPREKPKEAVGPSSSGEKKSLELKPAGQSVVAKQPETPARSDGPATSQLRSAPQYPERPDRSGTLATTSARNAMATAKPEQVSASAATTAEFDAAIKQAKELQFVTLEGEDEADSRPTSSGGPATDDEAECSRPGTPKKRKSKYAGFEDRFQCMQKHTGDKPSNPNAETIAILQQMADYYGQMGDEWRIRAYRKAIGTLRNHPTKVCTREEALALPQIGGRLAEKIEEIVATKRLRRLDSARAEPQDQVLRTFMGVYAAGFAKASEWVAQGYKTLDELLGKAVLTGNQRIGIEHYEDFNSRIPRAEVEQHGAVVTKALRRIDPAFEVIIGGSYRRGSKDSGDIDCIITHPDTNAAHLRAVVLDQLVPKLTKSGFLVASLAITSRDDGSKWQGASCLPNSTTWRRLDLLLVPSDEIGAALIYFTGNDIFNRSLRLLASKKGMRLNQRGLYKNVIRGKGREKLSEGTLVEGRDEKRIFEVLRVPWRPPEHRIC